jgi:hypothetical protein
MQRVFLAVAGSKMETAPAIPTMLLAAAPKLARAHPVGPQPRLTVAAGCTAALAPGPRLRRVRRGLGHRAQSTADIAKRRSRTAAKSDHSFAHFAKPLDPPRSLEQWLTLTCRMVADSTSRRRRTLDLSCNTAVTTLLRGVESLFYTPTAPLTGIALFFSSGNISSGQLSLEGWY